MAQPLGIYVSVPFCRAKCTFCNFASEVFPPERMQTYVDRLLLEIRGARQRAERKALAVPHTVDTIFFGGGTPSLLSPRQFGQIFQALSEEFSIVQNAEITVEAAPGQLADDLLEAIAGNGVNRISFGVQSLVDAEARAVGRLHTAEQCIADLQRVREAGIRNRSFDLIAGLPHQTATSFHRSLEGAIACGVEHLSVYMLEVDEESRLGREVGKVRAQSQLAVLGQEAARYGASTVPTEDECADLYLQACEELEAAGVRQYEISNFAREGFESRHNRKYWERKPYLGLGLDAHSMLLSEEDGRISGRFANPDDLEVYLQGEGQTEMERIEGIAAFEEAVFLGLRLQEGLLLEELAQTHGELVVNTLLERARELEPAALIRMEKDRIRLTPKGRVLSSSVFGELLAASG